MYYILIYEICLLILLDRSHHITMFFLVEFPLMSGRVTAQSQYSDRIRWT